MRVPSQLHGGPHKNHERSSRAFFPLLKSSFIALLASLSLSLSIFSFSLSMRFCFCSAVSFFFFPPFLVFLDFFFFLSLPFFPWCMHCVLKKPRMSRHVEEKQHDKYIYVQYKWYTHRIFDGCHCAQCCGSNDYYNIILKFPKIYRRQYHPTLVCSLPSCQIHHCHHQSPQRHSKLTSSLTSSPTSSTLVLHHHWNLHQLPGKCLR